MLGGDKRMNYDKLKSFVDDKSVAIDIQGNTIRVNHEIGNDNAWVEFEIDGRDEKQMAALINVYISKAKTGKVS